MNTMNTDTQRASAEANGAATACASAQAPWTAAAAGTVVINGSAGPNVLERKTKLAELRQHIADVIKKRDQI